MPATIRGLRSELARLKREMHCEDEPLLVEIMSDLPWEEFVGAYGATADDPRRVVSSAPGLRIVHRHHSEMGV